MTDKLVIITADDFGLSQQVNNAVERAHTEGVLTAASIMVGEKYAKDAARRARTLPNLGVGLHIALTRGTPVLPAAQIPGLVDSRGQFKSNLVKAGIGFFFMAPIRRQMQAEIRAQFEAFAELGLTLDHVNTHNHMHMHPTVLDMILNIGQDFALSAVRLPDFTNAPVYLKPWIRRIKQKLRLKKIRHNDILLGFNETGRIHAQTLSGFINNLPAGVTEIMTHPATGPWPGLDPQASDFNFDQELAALVHPDVKADLAHSNARAIRFGDLP